jgi:hypothetical protein
LHPSCICSLTPTTLPKFNNKITIQGAKKIGFEEFSHALQMVATAKGCPPAAVAAAVEGCGGPAVGSATTPDAVRFYDDRRTPTSAGGGRNC